MKRQLPKFLLLIAVVSILSITEGCSWQKNEPMVSEPMVLPYNTAALQNYSLSREYVSAGRYELAREHLLLALASVENEDFRNRLTLDIAAVDRLIRTTR